MVCSKEQLLNTISNSVNGFDKIAAEDKSSALLKCAAVAIKSAAEKQIYLEEKIASLLEENIKLKDSINMDEKTKRVDKIVDLMFENSMIKKNEIQGKKEQLLALEDKELSLLEETVINIPKRENSNLISDLTFLYNDNNIKGEDKENLKQALDRFVDEFEK